MTFVVDTNVILVANGQHEAVSPCCVAACAGVLREITTAGRIALDDAFEILLEYQRKSQPRKGKRPGDAFVKWVLRNRTNRTRCDEVAIPADARRGYRHFPEEPRLEAFDPSDRKFVAVSAAHPDRPEILQATDSKWGDWAPALEDHGIRVRFLCPAEMERFRSRWKKG